MAARVYEICEYGETAVEICEGVYAAVRREVMLWQSCGKVKGYVAAELW